MASPLDLVGPASLSISSLSPASAKSVSTGQQANFGQALESAISSVETSAGQAHEAAAKFLAGDSIDIHSVAIASQRAEMSLELFQQVRNKVVSAYQEIMRSQM